MINQRSRSFSFFNLSAERTPQLLTSHSYLLILYKSVAAGDTFISHF